LRHKGRRWFTDVRLRRTGREQGQKQELDH
jgi:hypothetical protein